MLMMIDHKYIDHSVPLSNKNNLCKSMDFAKVAVLKDENMLSFLSNDLRRNEELCLIAINAFSSALVDVHESLLTNPEFIIKVVPLDRDIPLDCDVLNRAFMQAQRG